MENNKYTEIWNGYCPESLLEGKIVKMKLNTSDFYESEKTGLQICIIPGVQAIVLNFRGKGKFKGMPIFADNSVNGELLSPQNTETFPFNNPPVVFQETEEFKVYLNTIK